MVDVIGTAFKLINNWDKIQRVIQLATPIITEYNKVSPELLSLIARLKDLGGPILAEYQKASDELSPLLNELLEELSPVMEGKPLKTEEKYDVRWAQSSLNYLGADPPLAVDGDYGEKTKKAVKDFQEARGLTVDGWLGPQTSVEIARELKEKRLMARKPAKPVGGV